MYPGTTEGRCQSTPADDGGEPYPVLKGVARDTGWTEGPQEGVVDSVNVVPEPPTSPEVTLPDPSLTCVQGSLHLWLL